MVTPKINIQEVGLFATPKSHAELSEMLDKFTGQEKVIAMSAAMWTWNFLAATINEAQGTRKEADGE